ncbi:hypothetical protein BpHYR1_042317 [Brachionus plicatilis]|uniref:Uncharacterized protein n=1 Tax=Brachionus plicatilis TaxID=10195 RepID=A0A3M7TAL4_BRAPC|nr:hypothetical protein BpHYR1_042317 [Brachionus plicatilis]
MTLNLGYYTYPNRLGLRIKISGKTFHCNTNHSNMFHRKKNHSKVNFFIASCLDIRIDSIRV